MRNNSGFSLSSLLLSIALTALLLLIVSGLLAIAISRHSETKDRLEAEVTLARAERIFRTYFSQALDIAYTNVAAPAGSFNLPGLQGWIRGNVGIPDGVEYDQFTDMGANDWHTIALFWREDSTLIGSNSYGGHPRKTAVWYRRPTLTTSGVIFFDGGPDNTTNPGGSLTPSYNGTFVDRISGLRIQKNQSNANFNKTTSIDVTLRVRYHIHHRRGFNWCTMRDIREVGECAVGGAAAAKDIERTFHVILQNGLIRAPAPGSPAVLSPTDKEERTMGNIYFFRLFNPARL